MKLTEKQKELLEGWEEVELGKRWTYLLKHKYTWFSFELQNDNGKGYIFVNIAVNFGHLDSMQSFRYFKGVGIPKDTFAAALMAANRIIKEQRG